MKVEGQLNYFARLFPVFVGLVELRAALLSVERRLIRMEFHALYRLALLHDERLDAHKQRMDILNGLLQLAQFVEPVHQITQRLPFLICLLQYLNQISFGFFFCL